MNQTVKPRGVTQPTGERRHESCGGRRRGRLEFTRVKGGMSRLERGEMRGCFCCGCCQRYPEEVSKEQRRETWGKRNGFYTKEMTILPCAFRENVVHTSMVCWSVRLLACCWPVAGWLPMGQAQTSFFRLFSVGHAPLSLFSRILSSLSSFLIQ